MFLNLVNKKNAKPIDADRLEELFAEGLSQKEVARRLRINEGTLSRRIHDSNTLSRAKQRGKQKRTK